MDEYQVDGIVTKRLINDVEEYRVRWTNYSEEFDTWEIEDHCVKCYPLILEMEAREFKSIVGLQPKITGLKIFHERIKLLVEWRGVGNRQYFYSLAIRSISPLMLVDYYEKSLSVPNIDDEITHFQDTLTECDEPSETIEVDEILAIANCGNRTLFMISSRNRDEASIVSSNFIKLNYAGLLIDFYEKHIFLRDS